MILWLIYFLCFKVDLVTTEEKRLLLNDPDVMNNRLNRMESVVAILNATVKQLTSQNHQLILTNQQQDIIIQQQQTSIQQQEQTIILLQSSFNSIKRYAAGGNYGETGSAAEYVCLPPDPNYVKTSGSDYGHMYGAEFYGNFFASNAHAQDVPCASCRTTLSTSVIMIPGKNTCYNGWREEYHGYLSSGANYHAAASAYVCVDINPEYIIGGVNKHLEEDGTVDTEDLSNILDSETKQEILTKLDEDKLQELDDGDIETEIVEADEYAFNLEGKIRQIKKFILVKTTALNTHAESFTPRIETTQPVHTINSSYTEHQNNSNYCLSDYRPSFILGLICDSRAYELNLKQRPKIHY
ncbi:Hypothetical predicted protein [Mytilus galloprovincialis]|uniref:Apextrin C-terminal domain-containing protein n=1 Tax=Mytilus galloprovincialis TaxID=29158 RepID=A0A8B6C3B7_MYTGA|nr:Hypothetical predicted protein [Mytilus galloprovincialis]